MPIKIGIDVGGTFTDFFVVDEHGRSRSFKVLSTPDSPADAVVQGLGKAASALGLTREKFLRDVSLIVHGTTITTNAVLTRRTARTGFLTTEGFRDLLHMRRGIRETYYDSKIDPPTPLVPRALIAPIRERIDRDGAVATPLDERAVLEALELFGDPFERPGELVADDVANGYVSPALARELYGVMIDPATGSVDREATNALRHARR